MMRDVADLGHAAGDGHDGDACRPDRRSGAVGSSRRSGPSGPSRAWGSRVWLLRHDFLSSVRRASPAATPRCGRGSAVSRAELGRGAPEHEPPRRRGRRDSRPPTSASARFCSTSRIACRCARRRCMISWTCSTRRGARPSDGSSIRISSGLAISARPIASICCSPPLSAPPGWSMRSASCGNSASTSSKSQPAPTVALAGGRGARGKRAGRQQQVLAHGQRAEDAPALRHDRDAVLRDRVGRPAAQRAALEEDLARARRREARHRPDQRGLAHAVAAEDRGDRALAAELEVEALQHVAVAVVGVDPARPASSVGSDMTEIDLADLGVGLHLAPAFPQR